MMNKKEQEFSWYGSLYKTREEKRVTLGWLSGYIRSDCLKFITKEIRRLTAEKRCKEAKQLKMQLPAIAVSVLFPGERLTEQAGGHTGYVLVDVDGMKTPATEYIGRCKGFPWLALAYISARGAGVHLFFRVETDTEQHEEVCRALYDIVETTLGEAPDRICTDIARTSLICWDADCYYNPDAEVFRLRTEPSGGQASAIPPAPSREGKNFLAAQQRGYQEMTERERLDLYLDQADRGTCRMKGQRHARLVSLAFSLNRAGFGQEAVENECVRRYAERDFDAKEITKTIASVYAKARVEHGTNRYRKDVADGPKYATSASYATKVPEKRQTHEEENKEVDKEDFDAPLPVFDRAFIDALPPLLRDMVHPTLKDEEADMALVGGLTMLSTITPNVSGRYHNRSISPSLYLYIVARAGSGKGILNSMRPSTEHWHRSVADRSRNQVMEYEKDELYYQAQVAKAKRSGKKLTDNPPAVVRQMNLNIPGSITQAKLTVQLSTNRHYPALMHESEIGVLSEAINQEHGKYVPQLNKIAHQEEIGRDSLANGYEHCARPLMGILLSGTFGQFTRFIPSADDGLFSRFLAYTVDKPVEWKDLTDEDNSPSSNNYYHDLGLRVLEMGNFLDKYPTFVCYTKKQRDRMNARFRYLSEKAKLYGDEDRQSIVNRLGRSHFCICMTLAAIRKAEAQCTDKTVVVSDADFDLAMTFILLFHEHVLRLSTRLRKNDSYLPSSDPNIYERLFRELPPQFRTAEAVSLSTSLGLPERSVSRRIKAWVERGLISRISAGKYIKNKPPEEVV